MILSLEAFCRAREEVLFYLSDPKPASPLRGLSQSASRGVIIGEQSEKELALALRDRCRAGGYGDTGTFKGLPG